MAAIRATTVAARNNEQKIRRHGDAVNVRCEFEIIKLPVRYVCLIGAIE